MKLSLSPPMGIDNNLTPPSPRLGPPSPIIILQQANPDTRDASSSPRISWSIWANRKEKIPDRSRRFNPGLCDRKSPLRAHSAHSNPTAYRRVIVPDRFGRIPRTIWRHCSIEGMGWQRTEARDVRDRSPGCLEKRVISGFVGVRREHHAAAVPRVEPICSFQPPHGPPGGQTSANSPLATMFARTGPRNWMMRSPISSKRMGGGTRTAPAAR
jgi:hypothetical protein